MRVIYYGRGAWGPRIRAGFFRILFFGMTWKARYRPREKSEFTTFHRGRGEVIKMWNIIFGGNEDCCPEGLGHSFAIVLASGSLCGGTVSDTVGLSRQPWASLGCANPWTRNFERTRTNRIPSSTFSEIYVIITSFPGPRESRRVILDPLCTTLGNKRGANSGK